MQFLINNLWFLLISVVVIAFVAFIIVKIINEINLNQLLKNKHNSMRINIGTNKNSFIKRISVLTSTALAPVVAVTLVITIGISASNIPSGDLRNLNNSDDIIEFYDGYSDLLGESISGKLDDGAIVSDYVESATDAPEYDSSIEALYRVSTTADVYGADVIDNSIIIGDETYQIDSTNTNIIQTSTDDALDMPSNQMITFTANKLNDDSCRREEYINGFYVDEEILTVITTEYSVGCYFEFEGYTSEEEFVLSNTEVKVYVYEISFELTLTTLYEFDGVLVGTYIDGNQLYVVTDTNIPYEKDGFTLDLHIPNYSVSKEGFEQTYGVLFKDIVYVEGVLPSAFISIYGINILEDDVEVEMLLVDDSFDVYFSEDEIKLVGNIYYFDSASMIFELEDPISNLKSIAFSYETSNGTLTYSNYIIE